MTTPKHLEKNKGGRPRLYDTPEKMQEVIDKWVMYCDINKKPMTMTGLANVLGMDRRSLVDYAHRDEFTPVIKRARAKVQQYLEEQLVSGKNAAGLIFNLKNNFGWTDERRIQQNITGGISLSTLFEQANKPKLVQNEVDILPEASQSLEIEAGEDFEPIGIDVPSEEKSST